MCNIQRLHCLLADRLELAVIDCRALCGVEMNPLARAICVTEHYSRLDLPSKRTNLPPLCRKHPDI